MLPFLAAWAAQRPEEEIKKVAKDTVEDAATEAVKVAAKEPVAREATEQPDRLFKTCQDENIL